MDCRTRQNKSSVPAISVEVTMIRAIRSSTVPTGVSYTNDFRWPPKKKSKELRSGERGSQTTSSPWPIYVAWRNSGKSEKFACVRVSSTLPWRSKSPHSSYRSTCLAHNSSNGYYYGDFHLLNVVCDPMFFPDWSSPNCLLPPL
ncbi:hypothetical protein TNCV_633531 [Trichonephila clavipes]|nr:hypothetical protein TNCV_633531 [Trichonephila clavipes]